MLGSSLQPGYFLQIQYEVLMHDLLTLGSIRSIRLESKILLGHQLVQATATNDNNYPSNRENPPGSDENPPARQKETPGIIQRPLATIHKHLGTPVIVVCSGPLHRVSSLETSGRCRTVCTLRALCDNTSPKAIYLPEILYLDHLAQSGHKYHAQLEPIQVAAEQRKAMRRF